MNTYYNPDDLAKFASMEEGLLFDFCPQVVVDALKVLEDLL
jgi:hypothetical protein